MIRNLAIKGGGVRGIAFVGALKELDAAEIFSGIERVSGTSAGAMLAAMISAGYNVEEIEKLMQSINFKKFEESFNPLAVVTHYGMHSGDYILGFTKDFLDRSPRGLNEDSTFADFKKAGCKDLYVFATDLNALSVAEFSFDKTPDVKVAEAVRASMSIPLYFKAWQFPDKNPNDHIYVDGGTVFNYPLSFFDDNRFTKAEVNDESLGLFLQSKTRTEAQFGFDHLLHYTRHLFEVLLNSQDVDFDEDHVLYSRSVIIDDLGILSTDFHLSEDDMTNLMNSGSKATIAYLKQKTVPSIPKATTASL
jgi:NTE family protein